MKPLLSKTTKPFLIYVLIVLAVSIPVYYIVVDTIWKSELDEHNKIIADKTAYGLNQLKLSEEELETSMHLWNNIQPGTDMRKVAATENVKHFKDSTYTIEKQKSYTKTPNIDRFRCLSTIIYVNNKPYHFIVETNIEESQETIAVIAITTVFFFIILVIGLLLLTRRLSTTVWTPFQDTLAKLKAFNLNSQQNLKFQETDIKEFNDLNLSLGRLIDHNISVFKSQKEFTENASHELQTPLAILKNKLDLLLQSDDLTQNQYHTVEEMNRALSRSSRINKNLLLLAKIDNNQFDGTEEINFHQLINQHLSSLREHFEHKHIDIDLALLSQINVRGNGNLAEIMISNLLLNAIRYTPAHGTVSVSLTGNSLTVSNTGTAALNTEMLFKRFARQSSESSGNGLGLALVNEICRFHHWKIAYDFKNNQHFFSICF